MREVRASSLPTPVSAPSASPEFRFAIVSDRTGGHRGHVFETALAKANLMKPDFVMSVGDLIEGYTQDVDEIAAQWGEFRGLLAGLEMPFYFVPGNHDLSNPVMAATWREQFGPTYYHFTYRGVLFICLNTEDGGASQISDEQVEHVRRALVENPGARWTLLFMHKPLWHAAEDASGRAQFERIEALLANRKYTVFAGHYHTYKKSVRNDRRYIVLATTGGGSQLRGPTYGQFDELAWVTMTDAGPRLANVLLDGILDEDVRTDASAARVDALSAALSVSVDTVYSKLARFAGGRTLLRIQNGTTSDLQFSAEVGASAPVELAPHRFESILVKAGQSLALPIDLRVARPTLLGSLRPIQIFWNAKVLDTEQPLLLNDTFGLGITDTHPMQETKRSVAVDGVLDEWGHLSHHIDGSHRRESPGYTRNAAKPGNFDASFDVAYDRENVYVAVRVLDDAIVAEPAREPWREDGIELSLDPRDDPARSADRRNYWEAWRTHVHIAFGAPDEHGACALFEPDKIPKTVRVVCARTKDGYSAEIALPHAVLDAMRPKSPWSSLRLNVGVHERDATSGPSTVVWWQPDWRWEENVPGSGTFVATRKN